MSLEAVETVLRNASQDPVSTPLNGAEAFFDSMGLMRGAYAPVGRFTFGVVIAGAALYAVRPSMFFHDDGKPRSWGSGKGQSAIPYWSIPLAAGIVCGVFI